VKSTREQQQRTPARSTTTAAPPATSSPAAPISDLAFRENLLALLPPEGRALFEPLVLPGWLRRRRNLAERDAALRALAADHIDSTSWRIARRLNIELARYFTRGSWQYDRDRGPPADPRHAAMHRALQLHGGNKLPSRSTIQRALASRPARQPKTF